MKRSPVPLIWAGLGTAILGIVGIIASVVLWLTHSLPNGVMGWLLAATSFTLFALWALFPADAKSNEIMTGEKWSSGETWFMICLTFSLLITARAAAITLFGDPTPGLLWVPVLNLIFGIVAMVLFGVLSIKGGRDWTD